MFFNNKQLLNKLTLLKCSNKYFKCNSYRNNKWECNKWDNKSNRATILKYKIAMETRFNKDARKSISKSIIIHKKWRIIVVEWVERIMDIIISKSERERLTQKSL